MQLPPAFYVIFFQIALFLFYPSFSSAQFQNNFLVKTENPQFIPAHFSSHIKDSLTNTKKSIEKNSLSAMYKSLILPGWGQISNRQYWKVPVIYAGFAASIYSLDFANKHYQDFRKAYVFRTDKDSATIDKYDPSLINGEPKYSEQQLKIARDYYRRNLEISVMITAGIYILNVIDAYVSSELLKFDMSDDLSIQFLPPVISDFRRQKYFYSGINLTF